MLYLAIFIFGTCAGAFIDRWWASYLESGEDLRSVKRHSAASKAINPRRWE